MCRFYEGEIQDFWIKSIHSSKREPNMNYLKKLVKNLIQLAGRSFARCAYTISVGTSHSIYGTNLTTGSFSYRPRLVMWKVSYLSILWILLLLLRYIISPVVDTWVCLIKHDFSICCTFLWRHTHGEIKASHTTEEKDGLQLFIHSLRLYCQTVKTVDLVMMPINQYLSSGLFNESYHYDR